MANEKRTVTLRLPGFVQPRNVVIYISCHNALSLELTKFLSHLAIFQLFLKCCFCMYRSKKKQNSELAEKQTYENTNGGRIKRTDLDFVGFEKTNGGPIIIPCSTLISYEKPLGELKKRP